MNLLNSPYLSYSGTPVQQVWLNNNLVWSGGSLWTGLGPDNNWTTATNWSGAITPVANSFLTFAGTTRLTPFNDFVTDTTFGRVTFYSTAGAFQLTGNKLIIGNRGFTNNSTNTQTINNNVVLTPGNNIVGCTSGPVTFAGALSGSGGIAKSGASTLTYSGVSTYTGQTIINQGNITIASSSTLNGVISGPGSLIKMGNSTLTLGATNTYSGGTEFYQGIIVFNSSHAFGTGLFTSRGGTDIRTGGAFSLQNDFLLDVGLGLRTSGAPTVTLTGNISGAGGLSKAGNGTYDLQGTLTYTVATNIAGGFLQAKKTVGASTATASFQSGGLSLSVSFDIAPPSGTTEFRFFQGVTNQTYTYISWSGLPVNSTATYNSTTSTLSVIVP